MWIWLFLKYLFFPKMLFSQGSAFLQQPCIPPKPGPTCPVLLLSHVCPPSKPAGDWCPPPTHPRPHHCLPTHQRTLKVVRLVKAQPDLVSEAAAALAHVGNTKAEAGQAGGAVLQVEVPILAGP